MAKQASPNQGGSKLSKLPHSRGAPVECASLLAPCAAAACCRAPEIANLRAQAKGPRSIEGFAEIFQTFRGRNWTCG
jgi:hypothetical protein